MFERTKDLRLSIIKQIELRATKYPDAISLAQGIPSFDTPNCIKRRVELALKRGVVAKYSLSPGLPELRELIEIQLAKENMFYDWDFIAAEQKLKLAIHLNPNSPAVHDTYTYYLSLTGYHEEAITEAKLALKLDPLSSLFSFRLGETHIIANQFDNKFNFQVFSKS